MILNALSSSEGLGDGVRRDIKFAAERTHLTYGSLKRSSNEERERSKGPLSWVLDAGSVTTLPVIGEHREILLFGTTFSLDESAK